MGGVGEEEEENSSGFEGAFRLTGGCGKYQWMCFAICNLQLVVMTWNHMGYIFIGAVPSHWCHVEGLENSGWNVEEIRNLSVPKIYSKGEESGNNSEINLRDFTYEQCKYFGVDYARLVEESGGDFETAFQIVHGGNSGNGVLPMEYCEKWEYDKRVYLSTVVTEFDLVCGRRYLVASIQAFYMIAAFVGTFVFGPLNDKVLGRRKCVLVGVVLVLAGGLCSTLSVSYSMFIAMRFLVGMGTAACMNATNIWLLEHLDIKSRASLSCLAGMFFGVGYALMPLYAYFLREWGQLQLAFSLSTVSLLSYFWIFPESPRWLASNGREEEAVELLIRIGRMNHSNKNWGDEEDLRNDLMRIVRSCGKVKGIRKRGNSEGENVFQLEEVAEEESRDGNIWRTMQHKLVEGVRNFKRLVETKELRRISFTVWTLFIGVAFVYYGFAFTTVGEGWSSGDPYLVVALGALMEIPASVIPIPFLSRCGRRPTFTGFYVIAGVSSLVLGVLIPSSGSGMDSGRFEILRTVVSMLGKLGIAAAFTILYLVVNEVYPTVVRGTGQGSGAVMGRIGSVSVPYVADLLGSVYPALPNYIFGVVALGGSLLAMFFIPETKDMSMKDQVGERSRGNNSKKEAE